MREILVKLKAGELSHEEASKKLKNEVKKSDNDESVYKMVSTY